MYHTVRIARQLASIRRITWLFWKYDSITNKCHGHSYANYRFSCSALYHNVQRDSAYAREKLNCPLHTSHTHNVITCHVYICRWTRLVSWPCATCPETPPATSHLPSRAPRPPPLSELLPSLPTPRQSGWALRLASMCQCSPISLV